jgi:hypothetical protein
MIVSHLTGDDDALFQVICSVMLLTGLTSTVAGIPIWIIGNTKIPRDEISLTGSCRCIEGGSICKIRKSMKKA